jgi:hypothetical protein
MINRGFDSHVGYLGGAEGYSFGGGDKNITKGHHDFWSDSDPAFDLVPHIDYSANFYSERTNGIIAEHATRRSAENSSLSLRCMVPSLSWQTIVFHPIRKPQTTALDFTFAGLASRSGCTTPYRTCMRLTHCQWPGK